MQEMQAEVSWQCGCRHLSCNEIVEAATGPDSSSCIMKLGPKAAQSLLAGQCMKHAHVDEAIRLQIIRSMPHTEFLVTVTNLHCNIDGEEIVVSRLSTSYPTWWV